VDGTLALVEPDGAVLHSVTPDGVPAQRALAEREPAPGAGAGLDTVAESDPVLDVTLIGDAPVILHESGRLVIADDEPVEHRSGGAVRLQQPAPTGGEVVVVHDDQTVHAVDLDSGA